MKSKLRNILIPFVLVVIVEFIFSPQIFFQFGVFEPYNGLLCISGLIFGPYGALGAALGNMVLDFANGYPPYEIIPSGIITFGISYFSYKLWYSGFKTKKITRPRLDNIYHLLLFFSIIILCGVIFSAIDGNLMVILLNIPNLIFFVTYFFNFVNLSFVFGVVGIWLSNKFDFAVTPKKSEKQVNKKLYRALLLSLIILSITLTVTIMLNLDNNIIIAESVLTGILLFAYLTKPFEYEVETSVNRSITEKIIDIFIVLIFIMSFLGVIVFYLFQNTILNGLSITNELFILIPGFIITDIILIIFLIPCIIILKYIEDNVLNPISSFSEIKQFIKEDEMIEADGLVNIYSEYLDENSEIGNLAQSYTELINHNNKYIGNIHKIEGEKKRVETELNIAKKIQEASLPTESLESDEFSVNGFSQPAKEVGGDFFDYYMVDDNNLAIVIGDASGKGVPAALLSMITQVMIKQLLKHDLNPSKVLYSMNNQLSENNPESMFLTLFLGIYNTKTKKLTFSNAGHESPLIKENDKFKYLTIESGIVLGILEDFEFINEEIDFEEELILYTDGITDSNNNNKEMYGADRLLKFFNEYDGKDDDVIKSFIENMNSFSKGCEQFDDMTLLYLKLKKDTQL